MPLRELTSLREDAAALAAADAQDAWRLAAGLPLGSTAAARAKEHRLASSRDGLAQVSEALADAEGEPARAGRAARLGALRDFLCAALARALEPGAAQELSELPRRPSVRPPGDAGLHRALPPVAVERDLPFLRERQRRGELERALAQALAEQAGVRSAAWEAAQSALHETGPAPVEAAALLHGRGWSDVAAPAPALERDGPPAQRLQGESEAELARRLTRAKLVAPEPISAAPPSHAEVVRTSCERVLRGTDAIAADLFAWLLERHTGARRYPGGAERHDLLHLLWAPRCASAFPRGEQLRTCRRWAELLGLDLLAGSAVKLDEEERPLKPLGGSAVAVDPPDAVRVAWQPAEGPRALASLLSALGTAQLRALPPGDAPPEDLWFGDPALAWACGALFASLARDPLFLRRCAKADLSRDDERAIAVAAVIDARVAAARTLGSLEALEGGLSSRSAQAMRELYARATLVELPEGLALRELDPLLAPWAELRGLSLASRARLALRERFDEDWFRNPRARPAILSLAARGGRPTLRELFAELASGPDDPARAPSVEPLLADLVEACR